MLSVFFLPVKLVSMEIMTSVILTTLSGLGSMAIGVKVFILPEEVNPEHDSSSLRGLRTPSCFSDGVGAAGRTARLGMADQPPPPLPGAY